MIYLFPVTRLSEGDAMLVNLQGVDLIEPIDVSQGSRIRLRNGDVVRTRETVEEIRQMLMEAEDG